MTPDPLLRCCQDHALLFPYASPSGKAEGSADFPFPQVGYVSSLEGIHCMLLFLGGWEVVKNFDTRNALSSLGPWVFWD